MRRETLTTVAAAAATMAVTLAVFWPADVRATRDTGRLPARIAVPRLKLDGCEVTLRPLQERLDANDTPEVEVEVLNPTDQLAEVELAISMMSRSPVPPMSRLLPASRSIWKHRCRILVGPGQTERRRLATGTKVLGGHRIHFVLSAGKKSVSTRPVLVAGGSPLLRPGLTPRQRARLPMMRRVLPRAQAHPARVAQR